MSILIQRGHGRDAVYTKILPCGFISVGSPALSYDKDDQVYELKRKTENQEVIRGIVRKLRVIKANASKRFGNKDLSKQLRIIEKSKLSISPILRQGSFYDDETQRILEITDRMINRYYEPYLNKNGDADLSD